MSNQAQSSSVLTEDDLANILLADLKRVVREYATAATESTCPTIRQMFTDLLNKTLTMQGQLFQAMQSANMYQQASKASQTELTKQLTSYKQSQQQVQSFLQQNQQIIYANPTAAGMANSNAGMTAH